MASTNRAAASRPKKQTAEDLYTKGRAIIAEISQANPRLARVERARTRGAALKAASAEFDHFEEPHDMSAVIGLIELFRFAGHDESFGSCWLGRFVADILCDVAFSGAGEVANNPSRVMEVLNSCVERFEADLKDSREMTTRHEDYEPMEAIA